MNNARKKESSHKEEQTYFSLAANKSSFTTPIAEVSMRIWPSSLLRFFGARKSPRKSSRKRQSSELPEGLCRSLSLDEIERATNNFDPDLLIGKGGFGRVYKGLMTIDGSITTVAIKCRSMDSLQGVKEFKAEVQLLCQLRHDHLVSLLGFCDDKGKNILVYEYMSNRSLGDKLYRNPLSWKQRLRICIGVASALHYLHTGIKKPIIHRDVKPTNILLDAKLVPKLSDFGLSQMEPKPTKDIEVRGTYGYADPEYISGLSLTTKSDVYSFGVLLLEVLCVRKPFDITLKDEYKHLVDSAKLGVVRGAIDDMIDPFLRGKIAPQCLRKYMDIAMSCVHHRGSERPCMVEVETELEHALELQ